MTGYIYFFRNSNLVDVDLRSLGIVGSRIRLDSNNFLVDIQLDGLQNVGHDFIPNNKRLTALAFKKWCSLFL